VVARNVRGRRLAFSSRIERDYASSDVYFIAVGTPPGPDGGADLSAVFAAAETVARTAQKPAVLAIKSTVPVGTGDAVHAAIEPVAGHRICLASNPEFLKEGAA